VFYYFIRTQSQNLHFENVHKRIKKFIVRTSKPIMTG